MLAFELAGPLGGGDDMFAELNNISKLLAAICSVGVQPIEDCLRQLLDQRGLDTAVGTQLDIIGKLVGQPRNGLDDDTYRRYCRAAISANRSTATVEDLLRVVTLVVFDPVAHYSVVPQANATVVLRVEAIAITAALAAVVYLFLARSAAAGIRVMLEYGISPPAQWFRFNSGPGFNQGHLIGRIDH